MAEVVVEIGSLVARAGAQVAFGDKVEVDGATLVPVALGIYGFGGGSGDGGTGDAGEPADQGAAQAATRGGGSGGGGSSISIPLGAYVGRDGHVRFVPNVVAVLGVAIPLTFVAGQALARIARALR
jgi:uncharacterized spore protein YtfJ